MQHASDLWQSAVVAFGGLCVLIGVASFVPALQLPWLKRRPDGRRRGIATGLGGLAIILMFGPGLESWNDVAIDILGLAGVVLLGLSIALLAMTRQRKT
jgi:hypothetical protein